ncbi:MAG: DUF4489 domain-containing protein [Clostridiaceae bacterium]|nr:DUF4489 domain-containing protein [Clostridiaceae bacterium]
MKATRIDFDEMWEKHFDNYRGWFHVADCLFPSREPRKPVENANIQEEYNVAHSLPVSDENSSNTFSVHDDNSSNVLSYPKCSSSDIFYPVEKDDYYLSDFESESHSYNKGSENPDKTIADDKENENNTPPVTDTESGKIVRCHTCIKQPDNIIFECDTGLGFAFVTPKEGASIYVPSATCISKTLGTISIDTSNLKKPKTKIHFSCNICFIPKSDKGTSQLEFILSRSYNNSAESPLGNWIYDLADKSERVSQTFKFNYCSCNSFPGLYTYYIRVMPVYIRNCSVLITNCHIGAFAQSK